LASDPHNCGACGHDCGAGLGAAGANATCSQSVCAPVLLVGAQSTVDALVTDGTSLFWISDGVVYRKDLAGGVVMALTPQLAPIQLAVDDAFIYATGFGDDSVRRFQKDGGAPLLIALQPNAVGLALDATNVYYTGIGDNADALRRVPKSTDGGVAPV